MADEKEKKPEAPQVDKDKSFLAENAATSYGLEDHEATAQDPRVNELRHARSEHANVAPKPKTPIASPKNVSHEHLPASSPAQTAMVARRETPEPSPVNNQPPETPVTPARKNSLEVGDAPKDVAENERPTKFYSIMVMEEHKDKPSVVTTETNTDVTFDPSKEYASKTTNTSGILYTDDDEPAPVPPPEVKFDLDDCFAFAVQLVKKAGAVAVALVSNNQRLSYTTKEHEKDLYTRADAEVEELITNAITERYPDHSIIAEEAVSKSETGQVTLTNAPTWIIDPIDGTMNYVHHFPYYCIAVAFLAEKETQFGIVFNPSLQEFYTARKGQGTNLNDQPIQTSGQKSLSEAMVLQEYSSGMNEARTATSMENANRLIKKTHALRSIGSSAMGLAMVATGVADAFYFFGLHVWDMAAGIILVTEAGGTVIDPAGGEVDIMSRRVLAAATHPLALELSAELVQNYPLPRDDETRIPIQPTKKDFQAQTDFSDSSISIESETSKQAEFHNVR